MTPCPYSSAFRSKGWSWSQTTPCRRRSTRLADRAPLGPDAGPENRHLVGEVEEVVQADTLSRLQLTGRLEQEGALRPPLVDHLLPRNFSGAAGVDGICCGPGSRAALVLLFVIGRGREAMSDICQPRHIRPRRALPVDDAPKHFEQPSVKSSQVPPVQVHH